MVSCLRVPDFPEGIPRRAAGFDCMPMHHVCSFFSFSFFFRMNQTGTTRDRNAKFETNREKRAYWCQRCKHTLCRVVGVGLDGGGGGSEGGEWLVVQYIDPTSYIYIYMPA